MLDFSLPAGAWRPLYRAYLHHGLPWLAGLVNGRRRPMIISRNDRKIPSGREMCRLMEASFSKCGAQPLSGGIVTIYQGTR